jgi:Protein of unknown function (DUF2695)
MADSIADDLEGELSALATELTAPGERECLRCYVVRMVHEFGCDGSRRWTRRWRDLRAPRSHGLLRTLARAGACCCDGELIFNVYRVADATPRACLGVARAGSTRPCAVAYPLLAKRPW